MPTAINQQIESKFTEINRNLGSDPEHGVIHVRKSSIHTHGWKYVKYRWYDYTGRQKIPIARLKFTCL